MSQKKKIKRKIPIPPEIRPYYKYALKLGLTELTFQVLLENGYNNIATISAIDEADLQALGIPLAQKSVLRRLVKGLQTETSERCQTEGTASVSYKSCKKEVKTVDGDFNLSTKIYESSTLVSTTAENPKCRSIAFESQTPLRSSEEDRFKPEIVIISTDDEDDYLECAERTDQKESFGTGSTDYQNTCQGSLDRDSEGECIETVNKKDPAECPETENTNVQKDCIETESRDEQHGCHGTFDAAHPKAEQDIHVVNNGKSTSNLDYEVVERKQVLFEDEESSSEGDGIQTYSSSSEYDESDSDSKGFKGLPDRRTAMRNRGGCQQQKKHKQLAKKQYSGYGMQLSGKSKSMQSKNTYVKGASGCIIGDNINITHNQMKEDVDIRVRSLEEQTRIALKNYEEEDVFVITEAYKQIKDELESSYFITVSGRPGDGKTTIAVRLLIEYSKNKRTCFICQTPDNWDIIAGLKGKKVVMVDDIFGTYLYDEMKAKPWISRFEKMEKIINGSNGDIYVIFTSRYYIIQEIKPYLDNFSLFKTQYIINLSDKEFKLYVFEKENILEKHLQFHNYKLDEETITQISHMQTPHGFPHCAKLFTTSYFLYQKGYSFFEDPIECLNSEFERFRLFDRSKFCALALIALEGGNLPESVLNDMIEKSEKTKTLIRVCGLPDNTPLSVLKDALICMLSDYVRKTPHESYIFNHETVSEAVCFSLSKSNLDFVIQYMHFGFVNKRIKTQAWKHGKDVSFIYIPYSLYPSLWRRFYTDIEKGNVRQVMEHQAWGDKEFFEVWPLVKSETDSEKQRFLIDLVKMTDKTYLRSVFYWAVFYGKDQLVEYFLENVNVNVKELSTALVMACIKEMPIPTIKKMIEKNADLEYIEKASDYTKTLELKNDEYDTDDSEYDYVVNLLHTLFGEKITSLFWNGGITPLQVAIFSKKMGIVRLLLECGSQITTRQNSGKTALHFASAINDLDIQKFLLDSLSSFPTYQKQQLINCADKKGRTALHYAKCKDMVILLVQFQANPNLRDIYGHTPLMYRAKFGITSDIVEAMCKVGKANINAVDSSGRNVLHIALRAKMRGDIVKCLIKMAELGLNFNSRTCDGETPVMAFVKIYAYPEERDSFIIAKVIQTLTECGANLNAVDSKGKTALHHSIDSTIQETPMHLLLNGANPTVSSWCECPLIYLVYRYSVLENNMDVKYILTMMIKYMPDINFSNKQGENLLHIVLKNKHMSSCTKCLIDVLLQKGINVLAKDAKGVTPIMMAATTSCETIKLFNKTNAILNAVDYKGRHALFYVAYKNCPKLDIVDYLLENGLSLNDCDIECKTPLHELLSSEHCCATYVKDYISRGAIVCLKDASGKSAFHFLFSERGVTASKDSQRVEQICETLIEHGADLNSVDNEGNTPLMYSCKQKNDISILRYLLSRKDVKKTNTNKDGQNILHLIVKNSQIKEKDKIDLIDKLQGHEFDFNAVDNFKKSPLISAIENKFLYLTLRLLTITNVFDDYNSMLSVCRTVIESGLPNKILEANSCNSEMKKKPEQVYSLLSDEKVRVLMRLFSDSKSVIMQDGTIVPHLLIKSKIKDDILNYIFSLIIKHQRACLTVADNEGRTALHFAIQYCKGERDCRRINIIHLFLKEGANPNHRDVSGRTVLHYCIQSNRSDIESAEIMKSLLFYGGDPFLANKKRKSALDVIKDTIPRLRTFMCINDKFEIPKETLLIIKWKVLRASAVTRDLSKSDQKQIGNIMIDVWEYDYFSGHRTKLLHLVCKYCNFKLGNLLFLFTLRADMKDGIGKTPLQHLLTSEVILREQKWNEMINKWSSYYDKIEELEYIGSSLLQDANLLLKGLLYRRADPNIKDEEGNTAFHLLLTSGWFGKYLLDAAILLLQYGADVNAVNKQGVTPLMLAAGHKRIETRFVLINILMRSGACVFTKDADGRDALEYSQKNICEYVRVSKHNTSLESMCSETKLGLAYMTLFEMAMPTSVFTDELCFREHRYEWL